MAVGLTFMAFLCFVHDSSDVVFVLEALLLFAVSTVLTLLRPATTHRYGRLVLARRCADGLAACNCPQIPCVPMLDHSFWPP